MFQHSETHWMVKTTLLWYTLRLVLVLYWDDIQTLFSIMKAFLAFPTRFQISLPAPNSHDSAPEVDGRYYC